MKLLQTLKNIKLITVGTKILIGVALTTNLLIGTLVYVNLRSAATIEKTVNDVITIRENLSQNLRETIFQLQQQFLDLPAFFESNPQQQIIREIKQRYAISDLKTYEGRSAYKSFFSRKERRDISKGATIVQNNQNTATVSYGLLDEQKNFTDKVVRITLQPDNPEEAAASIRQIIADVEQRESGAAALRQKVLALGEITADAGLEAEKTRTEILQHVEEIAAKEHLLEDIRGQQRNFTMYMGLLAGLANMVILFFLVRRIVERPLSQLTTTIDEIHNGRFPEVPRLHRTDQIGVLAEAIRKFRQALLDIRDEGLRKAQEKHIIDETVQTTTTMIDEIESRAKELVTLSENLQILAETTGTQAENVASNAEDTATNTDQVTDSAIQLEEITNTLNEQVQSQNELVGEIVEKNSQSQLHMEELGQAVKEIDTIIALVKDITEQTQLLALNATIEAARAGEAGKGFSVVATEMKELSTKTQRAASDIHQKVEAINRAGNTLTQNFAQIEGCLGNLNAATSTISSGVFSQTSAVSTISELAAKTSANTHNVSAAIQQVNKAAGETSELSRGVYEYAEDIAIQLTTLLNETTCKLQHVQTRKQEKIEQEKHTLQLLAEKKSSSCNFQNAQQALAA